MLDVKLIRSNSAKVEELLQRKDPDISLQGLLALDAEFCQLKQELEELRAQKNRQAKEVGFKKGRGEQCEAELEELARLKEKEPQLASRYTEIEKELQKQLAVLPNLPFDSIPCGRTAAENVEIFSKKEFPTVPFPQKNHVELSEQLSLFDFERGAKISGRNFVVYNEIASQIELALWNLMLETHQKNGFSLRMVPLLVKEETMYASGQLPKFASQLFRLSDEDFPLYLIPTSEVPLAGLYRDEILEEEQLPLLMTSLTPCFRREAGAAGSNERGLIRTHQFYKVELFALTLPEESERVHQKMIDSAHEVLDALDLHYRDMLLCTGDMSFASAKTVDIEVWLPGQQRYYEVSSASNCTAFQARRSLIRVRRKNGSIDYLHTLNASGLATSRLMVAILETNQTPDGEVLLPKALQQRVGFSRITKDGVT